MATGDLHSLSLHYEICVDQAPNKAMKPLKLLHGDQVHGIKRQGCEI